MFILILTENCDMDYKQNAKLYMQITITFCCKTKKQTVLECAKVKIIKKKKPTKNQFNQFNLVIVILIGLCCYCFFCLLFVFFFLNYYYLMVNK